ncbi:hypothetical protein [Methylobacterium hispanicum]|uniref:hypothetical protein n=1 Tax=Methylobacterium hispanicum TaxID=270350 RepID=UPI002F316C1D
MTEHTPPQAERDWDTIRAEAKRLYETTGSSFLSVASQLDINERTLKRWSSQDGGWQKANAPSATAERVRVMAEIASELERTPAPVVGTGDPATEPTLEEVEAKLLLRHRAQWAAVSNLASTAIRSRDEQSARLAYALSRTFATAQRSERIAYGLGTGETPPATIVLDRG